MESTHPFSVSFAPCFQAVLCRSQLFFRMFLDKLFQICADRFIMKQKRRCFSPFLLSPSLRRAWIEILHTNNICIGQTEQVAQAYRPIACIHDAHMGYEIAGQIERRKVDAVFVPLHGLKQGRRDALGRFALVVAGKHPVDVGFAHHPEAAAHIHGKMVDAGHHQQFVARSNGTLPCIPASSTFPPLASSCAVQNKSKRRHDPLYGPRRLLLQGSFACSTQAQYPGSG